jgi:signal transduction histidine kinase
MAMPPRVTLRLTLAIGFGLTVSLWAIASSFVSQRVDSTRRQSETLSTRYVLAQELLSTVRAQVLLASVLVRDALLDPTPRPSAEYRSDVARAYQAIDAALERYEPMLEGSGERVRVQRLRDEIGAFRVASIEILTTDSRTWQIEGPALLQRVLPRRESVLAVSEELQSINRAVYVDQQREAARLQAGLQRQVLLGLGGALGLSLVIAWSAFRYGVRLERTLVQQRAHEERIAADLSRLSAGAVKVQEDERRRIARELHDEVGQALTAVSLELTAAAQKLQDSGGDELLGDARALADGALRTVRDLSQLLHPSVLEDLGLSAALRSLLRGFERRTGIEVTLVDDSASTRAAPEVERAIYRIVQEAVTNVARHARARRMSVRVSRSPGRLTVVIEDDGVGFETGAPGEESRQPGLGLLGMRERISQLKGSLAVDSTPGHGTRLIVVVPLDDRAREHASPPAAAAQEVVGVRHE